MTPGLAVPEGISHIYTAKLVQLYHEKSSLFEINLLPIDERLHADLLVKTNSVKNAQKSLRQKIREKPNPETSRGVTKKRNELKEATSDLMEVVFGSSDFTKETLTIQPLSNEEFKKEPEAYISYHKLTVGPEIKEWIKATSPVLMLFASSKINPNIKFIGVRHWRDLLMFHFIKNLKDMGLKIPNRSGQGFIVRLLIYLQTLIEDKDLQTFDAFNLLGIDEPLFHLIYFLDSGCVLSNVQVHLQSLETDPRAGVFTLLIHVSIADSGLQKQLPG